MSYYVITNPVGPKRKLADFKSDDLAINFVTGARLNQVPQNPIELTWEAENEDGIKVSYNETAPVTLMSKELVDALHSAGVDNLDTYPVIIHSETGHPDCYDYLAVNIIGVIAAADMDQSEYDDDDDDDDDFDGLFDVTFDSIVIDEKKAKGHLLFRMAESVSTVIIHEKIVNVLKEQGGFGLTFTEPENHCT